MKFQSAINLMYLIESGIVLPLQYNRKATDDVALRTCTETPPFCLKIVRAANPEPDLHLTEGMAA